MSKTNYRKCVSLGVTGRQTSTCFPASIDKVNSNLRIPPEYYHHYDNTMKIYDDLLERQKNPLLNTLYDDLKHCSGAQELLFKRIEVVEAFQDLIQHALRERLSIIIDTPLGKDAHSLGMELVDRKMGHFILQSTHVPIHLRGIVNLECIFNHLAQPKESPRKKYSFNDANVTLVAP